MICTMMMMSKMVAAFLLVVPGGKVRADAAQDYWPAWRGPLASGVSMTAKPPLTWSEGQNIKWKVPVPGQGTSSPIVWGNEIFLKGKKSLYCISAR